MVDVSATSTAGDLIYTLDEAPDGAMIDADTGQIRWTPTEEQGPGTFAFIVTATSTTDASQFATEVFIVTVLEVNQPPVLTNILDQNTPEQSELTFTVSATDADLPAQRLVYRLGTDAPVGATIDPLTGQFRWTPTEAQGPGDYPVTIIVTDLAEDEGTDQQTITIMVEEVNLPPSISAIDDLSIDAGGTLVVALTATDSDTPANQLTFRADDIPATATLDPQTGIIRWQPSEADAGQNFEFAVSVIDDGNPNLSDSTVFCVDVIGVNNPPTIEPIADQTTPEGSLFVVDVMASDPDNDELAYALDDAPMGASIDPMTGQISWTPDEAQGPGDFIFTVRVSDDRDPPLEDIEVFTVTVLEVNNAPQFDAIADPVVDELTELNLTISATDSDTPANFLTFSFTDSPIGATIEPETGIVRWTPTEEQGPGDYTFTVQVADNGSPNLTDTASFTVSVQEVNLPPVISDVPPQTVEQFDELIVVLTAADPDSPLNDLTFEIVGEARGAVLLPGADMRSTEFRWTPGLETDAGTYDFTLVVRDDGNPTLMDSSTLTVEVTGSNLPPIIQPIADHTTAEESLFVLDVMASDPNNDDLTYTLDDAPSGASIDSATGQISWTPDESQGPGEYPFAVRVTDNGSPSLSESESFMVSVQEVNLPPEISDVPPQTVEQFDELMVAFTATDPDLPLNGLTFEIEGEARGARLLPGADPRSAEFRWAPGVGNDVGTYDFTIVVRDDGSPVLMDSTTLTVEVTLTGAFDDTFTVNENSTGNLLDVLQNDVPPRGSEPFTIVSVGVPDNGGMATIVGNLIDYSPAPGFFGTESFVYTVSDTMGVESSATVTVNVIEVCAFSNALTGWIAAEQGGLPGTAGTIVANACAATLNEGDSFLTTLATTFVVPVGTSELTFIYEALNFDTTDPAFINDAFEVALVDPTGASLVTPFLPGRDSFLNITEDLPAAFSSVVTLEAITGPSGQAQTLVTLDLSEVLAGETATLLFRLVNDDSDTGTAVTIFDYEIPGFGTGPTTGQSKFYVVDSAADAVFGYGSTGTADGSFLASDDSLDARGITSTAAGDRLWTVDGTSFEVGVYGGSGVRLGSWMATDLTQPEGIATDGTDIWIVDAADDTVRTYAAAAALDRGTLSAGAAFALDSQNTSAAGLATDGTNLWVVDDLADAVFVYDTTGLLQGSWQLDAANTNPSGITNDPTGGTSLWVVDRSGMVFYYANGTTALTGSLSASSSFGLDTRNASPDGIADPPVEFIAISTPFNSPIGIDYYEPSDAVVVSVNYSSGQPHNFEVIALDGTSTRFSDASGFSNEVKIATSRSGNPGGFVPGDLFVGNGSDGQIVRISDEGATVINPWVDLPGSQNGLFRGSLYVDQTGVFGGDLIAVTTGGEVWRITSDGSPTMIADVNVHLEGVIVVPDAPEYGPIAGHIIAGAEGQGLLYSFDANGNIETYNLGVAVEDIDFISRGENFFGVNFGTSRILGASATDFAPYAGGILLTQEVHSGSGLFHLSWNGSALPPSQSQSQQAPPALGNGNM